MKRIPRKEHRLKALSIKKLVPILVAAAILAIGFSSISALAQDVLTVVEFDATASEAPEALAVDRYGNIYVGLALTGEIKKVTTSGQVCTFANLPSPGEGFMTGLAFDQRGDLYVALSSFDPDTHGIWRITCDGSEVVLFARLLTVDCEPDGMPNGLDFDDRCNLYVSDSIGGKVWRISQQGTVSIWITDPLLQGTPPEPDAFPPFPLGANGIAFDEKGENLYVANTDFGRIVRIPVKNCGVAGEAEVFVEDPTLGGADGITFDNCGNLYVAVIAQDQLVMIDEDGNITPLAEGYSFQNPSDVRFGVDEQEDCLYVTNFAFFRIIGMVDEPPEPALLKMSIANNNE